jgi:hypothetical protein
MLPQPVDGGETRGLERRALAEGPERRRAGPQGMGPALTSTRDDGRSYSEQLVAIIFTLSTFSLGLLLGLELLA